jgi:hypothetical protein
MKKDVKHFLVKTEADFVDYLTAFFSVVGIISSILASNYLIAIVIFAIGFNAINSIRTGKKSIMINPVSTNKTGLYHVKNGNDNIYVLASSLDEAELFCEMENINGEISYMGNAKFFV